MTAPTPAQSSAPQATPQKATPERHPVLELLGRYRAIVQACWAHRAELAGPARMADEAAFLPAALSLVETPVHPAPRRMAYALMALFVLALVWACVGEIDIVATAPGRIIVSERTKTIQALEASIVKAVHVQDGDHVQAGQLLIELDPTIASADQSSVQEQLAAARSEALHTQMLLQALSTSSPSTPVLSKEMLSKQELALQIPRGLAPEITPAIQPQLEAEWQDIRAKLAKNQAEITRKQAELATVEASIAKLEATLPLAQSREADYKKLVDQGFISGHATQDKTRERIELERDLATQRARRAEAQAGLAESTQAQSAYRAETLRLLNERHAQASTKAKQLSADQAKAQQRQRQTQLTAPVEGIVQQLAVHTPGGVVTSAQPLMVIVPTGTGTSKGTGTNTSTGGQAGQDITAEVSIANLDIGFVNPGQEVEVKLETFSYTKYGTVHATVHTVSADAVTQDKTPDGKSAATGAAPAALASVYPAILTLHQKDMLIDGKRLPLSPGMNITAEIKTGKRRIIEYLLSPVQRAGSESLRER